jgi:hypothetical protein
MVSKRTIKFVGSEQGKLSKKWLNKFSLYKDGQPGGMIRTPPQYDTESVAIKEGKEVEEQYNKTGILPNLFKMF